MHYYILPNVSIWLKFYLGTDISYYNFNLELSELVLCIIIYFYANTVTILQCLRECTSVVESESVSHNHCHIIQPTLNNVSKC